MAVSTFQEKLEALGFKTYKGYLKGDHWKEFKKQHEQKVGLECSVCGSGDSHLHHIYYDRIGAELFSDVVPLCWKHHTAVHLLLKENRRGVRDTFWAIDKLCEALANVWDKDPTINERQIIGAVEKIASQEIERQKVKELLGKIKTAVRTGDKGMVDSIVRHQLWMIKNRKVLEEERRKLDSKTRAAISKVRRKMRKQKKKRKRL